MSKREKCKNCGRDMVLPEYGILQEKFIGRNNEYRTPKLHMFVCLNSLCNHCGILKICIVKNKEEEFKEKQKRNVTKK